MSILIHPDPVPLRVDETGTIRVGNTRVTLDVLMEDVQAGGAPEEIVRRMDTLTLAGRLRRPWRTTTGTGPNWTSTCARGTRQPTSSSSRSRRPILPSGPA